MDRADLIVVGAGAAGLFAALVAAREGARVALISARPLAETASYWAQGGLAAALAVDDSPELHLQDTLDAGRGLVRRSRRARSLPTRRPRASATSRRSACASTPTATATSRSGSRAGTRAAGSRTRAAARPAAGSCASSRADVAEHPRIDVLRGPARRRCSRPDGPRRAASTSTTARTLAGARRDPGHRRRGRAVVAHDQPARAPSAPAWCSPAPPAPTLADLEFVQFHPTAVDRHPRPRGVPGLRGGARRGRDAARRARRALRRRARAARRRRPGDRTLMARTGGPVYLDMRASTPGASRTSSRRCARPATTRRREPCPVAPAEPLRDGRHRHRPRRPHHRRRASTPSASAPARACTAPTGSPRTRSRECFVFGRRAALAALDEPAPPSAPGAPAPADVAAARARDARGDVARRRPRARRRGPRAAARRSAPARPPRGRCALAREETRGAHCAGDFRTSTQRLDGHHSVSSPRG